MGSIMRHGRTPERLRRRWEPALGGFGGGSHAKVGAKTDGPLIETTAFGPNPGALRMMSYAPKDLAAGAPLVVVLHGCTQNARKYDQHAAWTTLADERGFAVLYPEQRTANNPGGCFNWFLTADKARGLGEARSIHEMIETMAKRHKLDRSRVFVTGLSAGGAMAAALLADYPETFAAGAIIAGLPCGAAASMREALEAMARPAEKTAAELGDAVRSGSSHDGLWPRIAIWHGSADKVVAPRNADELVKQWLDVHGADPATFRDETIDGHGRRVWSVDGRDVVQSVTIAGMGHGAPLDARTGERKGAFMLEAGISSTRRIAAFFGLMPDDEVGAAVAPAQTAGAGAASSRTAASADRVMAADATTSAATGRDRARPAPGSGLGRSDGAHAVNGGQGAERSGSDAWLASFDRFGVGETITKALRAAGLMK